MAAAGPRRALIGPARSRGRFERQRPARRRLPVRHDAAPVLAEDGAEPPHAGGAEERGDVQRAPGELRQLDEHQPAGGDLHIAGRGQVLEDARVLHPRQHHQVPADPRRDHRHGQGGGGVQGPGPRGHAAAEAAEGPRGRRSRARCVWGPWPRNSRQWKRPAGEEAGQAISQAVRAGTLWLLSPQGCPQTLPVPPLRQNQSPNRAPLSLQGVFPPCSQQIIGNILKNSFMVKERGPAFS